MKCIAAWLLTGGVTLSVASPAGAGQAVTLDGPAPPVPNMWQGNDLVAVSFDTFLDRRNSFNLVMNALSGRTDGQVTNERPGFCRTDSLRHSVRCDITRCTRAAAS